MSCHPPTSIVIPHTLLALPIPSKSAFVTLWPPKAAGRHHLHPTSFMGWTALWKFLQNGKNSSCTTSQIASHCHDWPQLHLTPQLFGQLQPAPRTSKPCSVKLCMLVSSWLYHKHPKPLRDRHNPQNLLHLLGISEINSCLKRRCTPFILEPLLVSLWFSIM